MPPPNHIVSIDIDNSHDLICQMIRFDLMYLLVSIGCSHFLTFQILFSFSFFIICPNTFIVLKAEIFFFMMQNRAEIMTDITYHRKNNHISLHMMHATESCALIL